MRTLPFLPLLLVVALAHSQEIPSPTATSTPTASPVPRLVRLHFVPPPMEGTISLGIYDAGGKLVRVLDREDGIEDFTAGHDALETTWDGNDDHGQSLPAGKYHARGFLVGDLKIEGVDYFFNDWVTDDESPHLARITRIAAAEGGLRLEGTTADGQSGQFLYNPVNEQLRSSASIAWPVVEPAVRAQVAQALIEPVDLALGKGGSVWAISHLAAGSSGLAIVEVSGTAPAGPALRTLEIKPADPQPVGLAASPNEDRIYLLEEAPGWQRVRSLSLLAAGHEAGVSEWKEDFTREITSHKNFILVDGKPAQSPNESLNSPAPLSQKLRANPLERDQPGKVQLAAGFDAEGSYLQTADGLPLRTVSETAHLSRALVARHDPNALDFFQDDGAVVEQFRVSNLDQMIAFDCGTFELK